MTITTFKCPICSVPMNSYTGSEVLANASGIYLRCDNPECPPHESVYGFGNTEKAAYEIACQKYKKA